MQQNAKLHFLYSTYKNNSLPQINSENLNLVRKLLLELKTGKPHFMAIHTLLTEKILEDNSLDTFDIYCGNTNYTAQFMCWRFLKVLADFKVTPTKFKSTNAKNNLQRFTKNDLWSLFREMEPAASSILEEMEIL